MKKQYLTEELNRMKKLAGILESVEREEDGKYVDVTDDGEIREIKEFLIGYANQYYTLWGVIRELGAVKYVYIKNLSTNIEDAKRKANTDNVNEKLRGKTKTFYKVKFKNGIEQDVDENTYKGWVETILPFGKYKDESILDIALKDPSYLAWLFLNVKLKDRLKIYISELEPVKELLSKDSKYTEKSVLKDDLPDKAKKLASDRYGIELDLVIDPLSDAGKPTFKSNEMEVTTTINFLTFKNPKNPQKLLRINLIPKNYGDTLVAFKKLKKVKLLNRIITDLSGREIDSSVYTSIIDVKNIDFSKYETIQPYPEDLKGKNYKLTGYFIFSTDYEFKQSSLMFVATKVEMI